ncbi:MAG: Signal recognition particle receptor FtsY [Chlamydiales bacterium]|nr:Signal recognition particle receptor FtsY [Chlamydiales bacterium]MCH9620229.1 Signal recognition particle receptor FtsY [Chlamydiales bacterium]MCH9623056.1 Signal recognition particle receptor FtsY [Chlamydiales bacterium]
MTNVEQIRRLIEARKDSTSQFASLSRFLMTRGIAQSIADEITTEFLQEKREVNALKSSLRRRIRTAEELTLPAKIALVGPTGVGKSTTVKKLEAFYRDQPDCTILDTEGCNFYETDRVDAIGDFLAKEEPTAILLTLSAATKDVDIYGAIHQFSPLGLTGLIFTKLDETLSNGILLNVCQKTSLPIHYIAYGYPLPGHIEVADAENITHKILTDHNRQEFHFLRQLILK